MTPPLTDWLNAASLWQPEFRPRSAWAEHAPFAFWLVSVLRPRSIVELGTHRGYSYFAFCQAVQSLGPDCACAAVDTWKGDEHAGFYTEAVFASVSAQNEKYKDFSKLMRMTFADARETFADGSVDLLHVDGLHTYEAAKDDFTTWLPKLSDRAVVLFHDTNMRSRGFGVFRLWEEVRREYPGFEFLHCSGLGILGVGKQMPAELERFFGFDVDQATKAEIRSTYHRLGATIASNLAEVADENATLKAKLDESRAALRMVAGGRFALAFWGLPRVASRLARRTVKRLSSRS